MVKEEIAGPTSYDIKASVELLRTPRNEPSHGLTDKDSRVALLEVARIISWNLTFAAGIRNKTNYSRVRSRGHGVNECLNRLHLKMDMIGKSKNDKNRIFPPKNFPRGYVR